MGLWGEKWEGIDFARRSTVLKIEWDFFLPMSAAFCPTNQPLRVSEVIESRTGHQDDFQFLLQTYCLASCFILFQRNNLTLVLNLPAVFISRPFPGINSTSPLTSQRAQRHNLKTTTGSIPNSLEILILKDPTSQFKPTMASQPAVSALSAYRQVLRATRIAFHSQSCSSTTSTLYRTVC